MQILQQGDRPTLSEVLNRREESDAQLKQMIWKRDGTCGIRFHLNIPGEVKNNETIVRFFEKGVDHIRNTLMFSLIPLLTEKMYYGSTGPEYLAVVEEKDPYKIKRLMVDLEEKISAGRLYDVDVVTREGEVSRESIGAEPRRCFLCERDARICARSRAHSLEELAAWTEKQLQEGLDAE
ncbi:MAG: citrate lyase holo-[acyl-carrier protein] synthase [Peptoniphilaceae bacterium]|nr:citrate lyase holo-[acyl-carrier protein] synthase [Peptoniphilaceae bacterium]MDY3076300.1 citrate lyase holo-[acyl-carrier protein] synthase [Peptoniphilaceae bacterium]